MKSNTVSSLRAFAFVRGAVPLALAVFAFLTATLAHAVSDLPGGPKVNQLDFHAPVTHIAAEQHWLHMMMLVICSGIFVIVFGVMFYSIYKHRKSVGHRPASFHESVTVEIAWTIVPFIIVTLMGVMATKTVVESKDTSNPDLTIKVTGYQWKWGYDYLRGEGEGIAFISTLDNEHRKISSSGNTKDAPDDYLLRVDHPLVVPVGKKVRVITTADDVIHSFAVPSFGLKIDAIPGFVRDAWFKADKIGDYYGQCQELCGKEHAYMPIHVKVVSAEDYTRWVAQQRKLAAAKLDDPTKKWTMEDIVKRGASVYAKNCAVCHLDNGKGTGAVKPLDGSAKVLDSDSKVQIAVLLKGQNNVMPSWAQLSDTDIAAVITYTKNSWSNKTGQLVQPADVKAAR